MGMCQQRHQQACQPMYQHPPSPPRVVAGAPEQSWSSHAGAGSRCAVLGDHIAEEGWDATMADLGEWTAEAGDAISGAAEDAGDWISDAAGDVGDFVMDLF